jgi:hypothetical protein
VATVDHSTPFTDNNPEVPIMTSLDLVLAIGHRVLLLRRRTLRANQVYQPLNTQLLHKGIVLLPDFSVSLSERATEMRFTSKSDT